MPDLTAPVWVFCCVCGQAHNARAVPATADFRSLDRYWWCADEIACIMRASINEQQSRDWLADTAAMQRGLDAAWASLQEDGWRI